MPHKGVCYVDAGNIGVIPYPTTPYIYFVYIP